MNPQELEMQKQVQNRQLSPSRLPTVPLVSFELNFESLREFLNKMSVIIQQNTNFIEKLQDQITEKCQTNEVAMSLIEISRTINKQFNIFTNEALGLKIPSLAIANQHTNESLTKICDYIKDLQEFKKNFETRLTKVELKVRKKIGKNKFKDKIKRTKLKVRKEMKDQKDSIQSDIKNQEQQFNLKTSELNKKIGDLEIKTL